MNAIHRRRLLGVLGAMAARSVLADKTSRATAGTPTGRAGDKLTAARVPSAWPGQTHRRLLINTHIPDWDPALLARFDPASYVKTIAAAGYQSFMQ